MIGADHILAFLLGMLAMLVIGIVMAHITEASQKNAEREREENDPANWWKYGKKNPYDD